MWSDNVDYETVITDEKDPRFVHLSDELNLEYFNKHGEKVLKYNEYNELREPLFVLLVLSDGEAVACSSFKVMDADSIEIKRVYVKKEYRQKGIASSSVRQLEKIAEGRGFKYAYLETGKFNVEAINLYEKLGYRRDRNFGFFEDDDFCICMKKELRKGSL